MGSDTFASAYPDPRVSGRVSLSSFQPHSASSSASLPTDLLLSLLLSKSLLALALFIARDWILAQGYSVWTLNALTLCAGAAALCIWERETTSAFYPVLFAAEVLLSLLALSNLSVMRHVMLTSFNTLWTRGIPITFLSPSGGKKALGKNNAVFITFALVGASYLLDSLLTGQASRIGYSYLLAYLVVCGQRSEMLAAHNGDNQTRDRVHATGAVVAALFASAAAWLRWLFQTTPTAFSPPAPAVTTPTFDSSFSLPAPTLSLLLPSAILLAATYLVFDPLLSRALLAHFPAARQVGAGWPIAVISTVFVGYIGFGQGIGVAEAGVGGLAWTAITHLISSDPRAAMVSSVAGANAIATAPPKRPLIAQLAVFYRHLRTTIKTILATPDSRRIYFFLCLNLAYMVVQMLYGIWTNSLGLISDSIHMFFDCLALGMGLFASVMATWRPNEKFTYGYSRVETLSGFANGLFLCLISIFIVFEAIQRLLNPPEMNTNQLLVVSSVGLAVNLVGMFATGHHHHGHSHGGHDHGHSHGPPKPKPVSDHAGHDHSGHDHSGHDHSGHDHSGHDHDDDDEHSHEGHAHHGSHNMKGVFLHVMADTLGSVGVIISTLLINWYGWTGFDPLASIFIAVLIFASVVPLVADSGQLLVLDMGEEREAEVRAALLSLKNIEGLASYTSARFWPKDPSTMIGSLAIQLAPSSSNHDPSHPESIAASGGKTYHYANVEKVTARVQKALRNAIGGLEELTIQVEPTHGLATL
ncbi:hypothetical protein RQP46_002155 [Phenoliferia psychrophenolica]